MIEAIEACRWLKERYLEVEDYAMAAECREREKWLLREVYGPPQFLRARADTIERARS